MCEAEAGLGKPMACPIDSYEADCGSGNQCYALCRPEKDCSAGHFLPPWGVLLLLVFCSIAWAMLLLIYMSCYKTITRPPPPLVDAALVMEPLHASPAEAADPERGTA